MRALIYELPEAAGAGLLDIAGRPLLIRQLQWLRELGIEEVVVEVCDDASAVERGALLLGSDPLVARCTVVPTPSPLGIERLAARAGLGDDELFVAVPAHLLVHALLALPSAPSRVAFTTAALLAHEPPALAFRTRRAEAEGEPSPRPGWAMLVADAASAHAVSCALLERQLEGPLIHAAEVRPGLWFARGARAADDATLLPPVLLGADARVFSRARVGPNVILGAGVVVERESVLSELRVAPRVLIGEGARIRQAHVDALGLTSLADGSRTEIRDPLLLSRVIKPVTSPGARVAALLLGLLLLLPWALVSGLRAAFGRPTYRKLRLAEAELHLGTLGVRALDLAPALFDVLLGRRDLLGIAQPPALELAASQAAKGQGGPARAGAIDLSHRLAEGASPATLLAVWRWYLLNKTAALDRAVLAGRGKQPRNAEKIRGDRAESFDSSPRVQ